MHHLTLITATGDRPEAFRLCELWMSLQSRQPDEWIVVDDGEISTKCTRGQTCVRRERTSSDPNNTLPLNLLEALSYVTTDSVAFIEDDDWYAPEYLAIVSNRLKEAELVGEGNAIYYHVGLPGWKFMRNTRHASLSATAVRGSALTALRRFCDPLSNPSVDLRLWRGFAGRVHDSESPITLQLKGMPGRRGTLWSHDPQANYTFDADYFRLKEWIGEAADRIREVMRGSTFARGNPSV